MEEGFNNPDVAGDFEHLAIGHGARQRFKDALNLAKLKQNEGCYFEVEDGDEYGDYDDGEEVYDDDTFSNFYYTNPEFDEKLKQEVVEGENSVKVPKGRVSLCEYLAGTNFTTMEAGMTSLTEDGFVKKLIVQEGNGKEIPEKCKVFFHYEAIYEGGAEVFDSTFIRKHPACFDLREPFTIPGLEIAIRSMTIGEAARFIIYPQLAYGELGCAPRIPKNSKILYVIQMLQLLDEKQMSVPHYMTAHERSQLSFSVIMETCKQFQRDGNAYYQDSNYHWAIRKWRKAANMLEDYPVAVAEDEVARTDLIGQLYANLAQGYLKLEKPAQACSACKVGLKVVSGPDSFKLLIRFSKAKLMLGDYEASLNLCNDAAQFRPSSSAIRDVRLEIKQAKGERDDMWRNIYNKPKPKTPKLATNADVTAKLATLAITATSSKTVSKVKTPPKETNHVDKCRKELMEVGPDVVNFDNIDWDDLLVPDYAYSEKNMDADELLLKEEPF